MQAMCSPLFLPCIALALPIAGQLDSDRLRSQGPISLSRMQAMCSLLFLACIALALPTASRQLYPSHEFSHQDLLHISHGTAVMLVIV